MQVSRVFQFDASHMLPDHPKKCRNLHGHTYTLEVSVDGEPMGMTGMVMDYGDLKVAVDSVVERYDHAYMYNMNTLDTLEDEIARLLSVSNRRTKAIDGRTTTENIAKQILRELNAIGLEVSRVKLSETPSTFVILEG